MDQHYILAAILIIWQGVAATEHALFVRVPRQQPRGIFGEEGYNIPRPSGPPLLEEQRDKREAQEQSLPLQNVFRWFQEQFPNQNRRKAIRQTGQGNLDVPSRQYLPIPSAPGSSTPRPFQPYPSKPSQPFPSQPSQPFPSQPSQPFPSRPSQPFPSRPSQPFPSQPSQPFPSQPSQPFPSQPSEPQYPTDEPIPSGPNQPPTSFPSKPSSTFEPQPAPQPFPSQRPPSFPSTVKPLPSNPPPTHSEDDGHVHPPHIHAIDVTCAKDQMDIRIEFDRVFDGTIYSKGHYNEPACRHVAAGSGQTVYQFTLYLDQCGTRFVDAFSTNEGRAYLENTLVLQNEVGYQEVWDTIRLVQCLWEGNIKQRLTSGLTVGMLDQQVVTFSGDTASTQLDVRVGKFGDGGAGSSATGLVQIGTDMSLVVTIDGDPGFDVQVKECIAKPAGEVTEGLTTTPDESVLRLTDERGCPLKTKIFGAFQKKRGGVGIGGQTSTLYAYAHFQAFKFPDRMDVTIECDVELCKGDCDYCPDVEQNSVGFSARRKRESNSSLSESSLEDLVEAVRMVQHMRVVTPEELSLMSEAGSPSTFINEQRVLHIEPSVCMSRWGFATASILLLSALTASCLVSVSLYIRGWKNQPHILKAQGLNYSPNSIGHR